MEFNKLIEGLKELRIHFGISCAAVGCVDLRTAPFRAVDHSREREEQGTRFLENRGKGLLIDRAGERSHGHRYSSLIKCMLSGTQEEL